jgi:transposase-like protein
MTLPDYDPSLGGSDMSSQRFSPEFKDEAVRQIVERGYSVADVEERDILKKAARYFAQEPE